MPGISIHAVDIGRGAAAKGLRVRVDRIGDETSTFVADGLVGANGLVNAAALGGVMPRGVYEATFYIGEYLAAGGTTPTFLDIVPFRFAINDPESHCHLPFKFTPYGFSCFRGAE